MPTRTLLRLTIFVLSAPFVFLSRVAFFCGSPKLIKDLNICLETISHAFPAPEIYIKTLVIAEDHRSDLHPGVDPIAIMRCCLILITLKRPQGGSTIEQQLVRVILGRYERTIARKIREQIIAIEISRHFEKRHIASAYLSVAFYGTDQQGLDAARRALKISVGNDETNAALFVVSKLKYPEPLIPSPTWTANIRNRVLHIRKKTLESRYDFTSD